jgi:UDP-N-acetylglucosamine 2-epimerase (non-hydrolysing)
MRLMTVIGTRPEAIKLAPIIDLANRRNDRFESIVVTTGQHREMLDQMLRQFDIMPDCDLNIMKPGQELCHVTTAALEGISAAIGRFSPDLVIVQGDTSTTFAGALAAFYAHVPVAHVEAGLRSFDRQQPWPEETNRCLTSQVTDFHFPPTGRSRQNLLSEGISPQRIWVTGNTSIDALFMTLERLRRSGDSSAGTLAAGQGNWDRTILVTAHRRENHGAPMASVCRALLEILDAFPDTGVLFPVHMSPRVRETVFSILSDHDRVALVDPLDYEQFVVAMDEAHLILTDSGGVQEEAPSLGKPVLVLRETTERPEAAEAGVARIIGTQQRRIVEEASRLLGNTAAYQEMAQALNPFGDGHAAGKILDVLETSDLSALGTSSAGNVEPAQPEVI